VVLAPKRTERVAPNFHEPQNVEGEMSGELKIRWNDGSKGYVDTFDSDVFASAGQKVFTHEVLAPTGKKYGAARCRASVFGKLAELDYVAFSKFNDSQGMELGVLRLHFEDSDRVKIISASWKGVGDQTFTVADVVSSSTSFLFWHRTSLPQRTLRRSLSRFKNDLGKKYFGRS
jgi:hypothetical protein